MKQLAVFLVLWVIFGGNVALSEHVPWKGGVSVIIFYPWEATSEVELRIFDGWYAKEDIDLGMVKYSARAQFTAEANSATFLLKGFQPQHKYTLKMTLYPEKSGAARYTFFKTFTTGASDFADCRGYLRKNGETEKVCAAAIIWPEIQA